MWRLTDSFIHGEPRTASTDGGLLVTINFTFCFFLGRYCFCGNAYPVQKIYMAYANNNISYFLLTKITAECFIRFVVIWFTRCSVTVYLLNESKLLQFY